MTFKQIPPCCTCCTNPVKWNYKLKSWRPYCSAKCRANDPKFKQSIISKYGCHPGHTQQSIEKRKNTCMEKYGVEFPLQDTIIHKQTIDTIINKYGSQFRSSDVINKKSINTMVDRYGVKYSGQSPVLLEQQYNTNIERYGVKHPLQYKEFVEKMRRTNLDRYGVEFIAYSKNKQDSTIFTNIEKYGGHFSQQHMVDIIPLIEDYDWLFNQYINLNKTAQQIADELGITNRTLCNYLRRHEIAINYKVGYSHKCICWLDQIVEQEGINIRHALNSGEYRIPRTRYKADGYCKETNTIYEFHGDCWHGNPILFKSDECCHPFDSEVTAGALYTKTISRENEIRELGYNLVVLWEYDFDNNLVY
jgi:hypothetical protein